MKSLFVDTNIFLRYLTADDLSQYNRCKELFRKATEGSVALTTSGLVIAELVWTLLSYYKVPKSEVIEKIAVIVGTDSLRLPDKQVIADALVLYGRKNIDYIDAYNAALMKRLVLNTICSYDRDFDLVEGITREKP